MAFGLGLSGALGGAATGAGIGSLIPGLGTALGGIIGGGMGLLSGLFGGGSGRKDQEKLMNKAWGYEKEGMALQYQYGQQAADAAQERNLDMWNKTNFEAQRQHLENAGLSPALFYGGAGGGATSTAGGQATQPSGPSGNPVAMALQLKSIEIQQKQMESQTMLNAAQAAKATAEAEKTRGVDTRAAEATVENLIEQTKNEKERRALIKSETRLNMANEDLTAVTTNFTEAKTNETKGLLQKTVRESEALLRQIKGMEIDNEIKEKTMQNVIDQQALQTAQMVKNLTKTDAEISAIRQNVKTMINDMSVKIEGNQIRWEELQNDMVKHLNNLGISEKQLDQNETKILIQAFQSLIQLAKIAE